MVIPEPFWPVCRRRLQALEAKIVGVDLDAGETSWHYDVDRLIDAVTPATKLIVICTPNNPTGNAMSLADVRRLAQLRLPLLVDAAYSDFDPAVDLMSLVHEFPRVVVTRTFSKAYCLAGLRVGYGVGSAEVLDYVDRFLVPGSAVSSAALHAASAALEDDAYHDHQVNRIIVERIAAVAGAARPGPAGVGVEGQLPQRRRLRAPRGRRRHDHGVAGARHRGAPVRSDRADQHRHRR